MSDTSKFRRIDEGKLKRKRTYKKEKQEKACHLRKEMEE
jgi:hypothetical protein